MRFLFVVPPLVGHINPTVGLGARPAEQGHEAAWAGHPEFITRLVGARATVFPCAVPDSAAVERPADPRGPAALEFLWESFLIPLAEAMIPGVDAAVDEFKPDVLVVDRQAVAGAVVAERLGIPWATSATTAAELADPLGGMPKVATWVREMLLGLELEHGDPAAATSERYQHTYGDLRFSPDLVLAYSGEQLSGRPDELADTLKYVGPSLAERPSDPGFPWHMLPEPGTKPVVLISVGTANVAAGAEYHGIPLVVAPIRDDQPIVARQAVDAGVAERVRFGRARAEQIGAALDKVLTEPGYRASAEQVAASFKAAGGARAAARELIRLAERTA
jgi:UDP:flavonoid glycosyltransferase YjiC (YdhE family)